MEEMKQPFKCPVCGGTGLVPGGFYLKDNNATTWVSDNAAEPCRSCFGSGMVWAEPEGQRFGILRV